MKNLKQLQEQRGKLRYEAQLILDAAETEKRGLNESESKKFDDIKSDLTKTHDMIAKRSYLADDDAAQLRNGVGVSDSEEGHIEQRSGVSHVLGDSFDLRSLAIGAFEVGTKEFLDITQKFDEYSAIVSLVSPGVVIRSSHGRPMNVPVIAKGAGESRTEGQTGTTDSANSFSDADLTVTRYGSKVIPVTIEMLEDAEFNVTGQVGQLGMARCATAFDTDKTSAITGGATAVALLAASAGLTVQDLINAKMTGVSRYVRRNVKTSMNSATHYALLTGLDLDNRPIHSDWKAIASDLLAPENVIVNDELADDTALVGNFDEALYVRVKNPPTVQVIDVSANKNYEVHMRGGVVVRNADAIAFIS
jgi:HK97 family phage major capsid protein